MTTAIETDDDLICSECGAEAANDECEECGGDGFVWHDGDAEEPWTGYEECESCNGKGRFIYCRTHGELNW